MPSREFQRPKRVLSEFLGRELLYDFYLKKLDADRIQAVQEIMNANPELSEELENISRGVMYCQQLAKTKVSQRHIGELESVKPWGRVAIEKILFRNWPEPMRWGAEALAISVVAVVIAIFVPWSEIEFSLPKHERKAPAKTAAEDTTPEEITQTVASAPERALTPKTALAPASKPLPGDVSATAPAPTAVTAPVVDRLKQEQKEKIIPSQGLLYQISMRIENDPKISEKVKEKIVALGGEKAGQVALGWRKTSPTGSYFHFTMPEIQYAELVKTLGEHGPVRIYKNPHPRIMPQGQIRIILWLEDKIQPVKNASAPTESNEAAKPDESVTLDPGASQGQ